MFSFSTVANLEKKLAAFTQGDESIPSIGVVKTPRPVIMCFGGQISTFVGLNRELYNSVKILRSYLDQCNSVLLSTGLGGIYPGIFQKELVEDTVRL